MDAKDEVKQRLPIEDVIGEYVQLKRAGRNYKGLSPFSNERTPSFMVSPEKQIWHDFSSNKGGDVFSFVMDMEGLDFKGALELLARKAGVDLSQYGRGDSTRSKAKAKAIELTSLAQQYYHLSLSKNATALKYVKERRGYTPDTIRRFGLGYSPESGSALLAFLRKRKASDNDIKTAGLATVRRGGLSDMFRGRLMVPLHDGQGQPIGFTARTFGDDQPKYINTPQTPAYDKSRHVYGLHLAKEAIRKADLAVLAEGNLDVIASHQAGVENVVATAGTALTRDQLSQLKRLTGNVALAFDQDRAGLAATERAIPIAQEVGVRLSIIDIPGGKDPDELVKQDPKLWQETAASGGTYVVDWFIDHFKTTYDLTMAEGKRDFSGRVLPIVARLTDPIEREHYVQVLAKLLGASNSAVNAKLEQVGTTTPRKPDRKAKVLPTADEQRQLKASAYQDQLLGLNLLYPEVQDSLNPVLPEQFDGEARQELAIWLKANPGQASDGVPKQLQQISDYVKIVLLKTEELYEDWSTPDRLIEAVGLARRLSKETKTKEKRQLSASIKAAEVAGDETEVTKLLKQFHALLKE